jgi:cysteinyl-tRNA synthetase
MPEFRLYDTMTRETRPLRPLEPGRLRFYSCGPTVYSYAHIGNFRTFLTADLVVRTAEALGWSVEYVSNITDVGHLTQDDMADAGGEDKLATALRSKEGARFANVWDLAEHYAEAFRQDWRRLGLREPMVRPKATTHMREQVLAIERLVAKGHAYETPTGVYFSVESFPRYGLLSGNTDQEKLMREVRGVVSDDNKRHPADFALWKKDDKHLMQWFSPWGWGFPGWHLECSVMAMAYLGETLDLHAGGEDLVFPHHECEIAQSESLTGRPFANHWVHTRFLQVDGEKMSKSRGNFHTVRDLIEGGADPLALRYALIAVPYGKPLNFTMQSLRDAARNVERFRECRALANRASHGGGEGPDALGRRLGRLADAALEAMCDDLNTSVALARALEGTGAIFRESETMSRASAEAALSYLDRIDALLGIAPEEANGPGAARPAAEPLIEGKPISQLIAERTDAKRAKDFARADAIRRAVDEAGFELRDTPAGTEWRARTGL